MLAMNVVLTTHFACQLADHAVDELHAVVDTAGTELRELLRQGLKALSAPPSQRLRALWGGEGPWGIKSKAGDRISEPTRRCDETARRARLGLPASKSTVKSGYLVTLWTSSQTSPRPAPCCGVCGFAPPWKRISSAGGSGLRPEQTRVSAGCLL